MQQRRIGKGIGYVHLIVTNMSDKEMNLAILNKLYEIADKVFNEGVNVKEGNYTASDLAKMKDSAFKDGYLKTEKKSYKNECNKQVEKDCFIAPMASVNVLSFVCSFCVVQIAAEDNKVSFCGELFTLSGFCKEFMPDEKRTKSNTYRGCAFFFKDGVKLEKLFKDAQKKSLAQSKEEIAAVPDDTQNEPIAAEKCTERTITPPAKENVSERKETASTAKVVAISIGVPVCLDIPPNNMRLDIAANKPLNAAVGDFLCGVGKVVHTLPLPPPRSKGMSELITYTNFYNTS